MENLIVWAKSLMPILRGSVGNRERINKGTVFATTEKQFDELQKLKAVHPADAPEGTDEPPEGTDEPPSVVEAIKPLLPVVDRPGASQPLSPVQDKPV